MATVLQILKISPSPGSPPELSLPLMFFDMLWYDCPASSAVLLFDFPCLKTHFLNSIVPHLQKSLSLTLTHFLPLAGNIIHPLNPVDDDDKPVLRYQSSTDSVSLTVSESDADLSGLTGNHPRDCDEFYALVPRLPRAAHSDTSISCPVLALQVTLFPGKGLSIGFITHHAVADASTVVSFIRAWALINRIGADDADYKISALRLTEANLFPFLDRKTVRNINGLDSVYWNEIVEFSFSVEPPPVKLPINMLRATFVLKREEIETIKNFLRAKIPSAVHVSSFTAVCALMWVCSARSAAPGGEDVAANETEYFAINVDCRGRLKPPLPANYLGNCLALVKAELKHGQVKGADGLMTAAAAIGAALKKETGILDGAENWPKEFAKLAGKRCYGVSGSPRFDFYAADFGWGKPKKTEVLSIDGGGAFSLLKSRDYEGGVEIGLSKPAVQMDPFTTVFNQTLADLLLHGSSIPFFRMPLVSRY